MAKNKRSTEENQLSYDLTWSILPPCYGPGTPGLLLGGQWDVPV
jgi:hypothetical protein